MANVVRFLEAGQIACSSSLAFDLFEQQEKCNNRRDSVLRVGIEHIHGDITALSIYESYKVCLSHSKVCIQVEQGLLVRLLILSRELSLQSIASITLMAFESEGTPICLQSSRVS
jgi:hypothetical protein